MCVIKKKRKIVNVLGNGSFMKGHGKKLGIKLQHTGIKFCTIEKKENLFVGHTIDKAKRKGRDL